MMATLTLFEHESRDFSWTEKDYAALERLSKEIGVEILRLGLRNGKRILQAAQHVGVVRLNGRTIQVLPKIYRSSEDATEAKRTREATRNLLYLLAYAGQ